WRTSAWTYFALVPVSAVLTAAIEFAWYGIATKIDPWRILQANWSERFFPRPAHEVAAVALAVAIIITARRVWSWRSASRQSPAVRPVRVNAPEHGTSA